MSEKKVYTVMVEFSVEADSLDNANDYVGAYLNRIFPSNDKSRILETNVQIHYGTDESNQRVFYAHPVDTPVDTHVEYDPDEYDKSWENEV